MEQISKETRYLVNNNVANSNQLEIRKNELKQEIDQQFDETKDILNTVDNDTALEYAT